MSIKNDDIDIAKGISLRSINDYKSSESFETEIPFDKILSNESSNVDSTLSTYFKELQESETDEFISPFEQKSIVKDVEGSYDDYDREIIRNIMAKKNILHNNDENEIPLYKTKTHSKETGGEFNKTKESIINDDPSLYEESPTHKKTKSNNTLPEVKESESIIEDIKQNEETDSRREIEEINNFDDIEELSNDTDIAELDTEIDDVSFLVENIDTATGEVAYPGKIEFSVIDQTLRDDVLDTVVEEFNEEESTDLLFGVKRAEIYYQIDKQIYSKRAQSNLSLKYVRGIKSGLMVPVTVAFVSIAIIILSVPILNYFFKKIEAAPLTENLQSDNSILSKIAKQREEEALRMKKQLDEQMRRLSEEKSRMEESIAQELEKKQSEIENKYQKEIENLRGQTMSSAERQRVMARLKEQKEAEISKAESEINELFEEKKLIIEKRNQEMAIAKEQIEKAVESKQFEVSQIKQEYEDEIKKQQEEKKKISSSLTELREHNEKVSQFTQRISQLVESGIREIEDGNIETGLTKFNLILDYYQSQSDFVLSDQELKSKMSTDIAFVSVITRLINDSKNTPLYNQDFQKIITQFKKVNQYYAQAEESFRNKNYEQAEKNYKNALNEVELISLSYDRIQAIETEIQNTRAIQYYEDSLALMNVNQFENALQGFKNIVEKTPLSDYKTQALENIIALSKQISNTEDTPVISQKAKRLFDEAEELENSKAYNKAIEKYQQVITDYPSSRYTARALNKTLSIQSLIETQKLSSLEITLRSNFRTKYNEFVENYESGNLFAARNSYLQALKNAFNSYTENSIDTFIKAEDEYIKSLLSEETGLTQQELNEKLSEARTELENEFNRQLTEQKQNLESEKNNIIEEYEKKLREASVSGENLEQLKEIQEKYETQLKQKDVEIAELSGLKSQNEELETQLNRQQEEITELNSKYETQLKEREKLLTRLKEAEGGQINEKLQKELQTLEVELEKNNNLLQEKETLLAEKQNEIQKISSSLEENTEALKEEKSFVEGLKDQLKTLYTKFEKQEQEKEEIVSKETEDLKERISEIQSKYNELENKIQRSQYNEEDIKKELEENYKRQYEKKITEERRKLNDEFARELAKIKNSKVIDNILTDKKEQIVKGTVIDDTESTEDARSTSFEINKGKTLVSRVIEVADTSVTFQFLSNSLIAKVSQDDVLSISRYTNGKEVVIGQLRVTYTSPNSLFGRGRITSIVDGYTIKSNDILKK